MATQKDRSPTMAALTAAPTRPGTFLPPKRVQFPPARGRVRSLPRPSLFTLATGILGLWKLRASTQPGACLSSCSADC
eukprot:scaffold30163_cov124-Isochrysis_galbana.AAC.7